jgi:hypothetical protein
MSGTEGIPVVHGREEVKTATLIPHVYLAGEIPDDDDRNAAKGSFGTDSNTFVHF